MSVVVKKVDEIPWIIPPMPGVKKVFYKVLLGGPENVPNFIMRVFKVEPNGEIPIHQHEWEHEIYILQGRGKVIWIENNEQKEAILEPNMCCYISPNIKHGFKNIGEDDWIFLCLIPRRD